MALYPLDGVRPAALTRVLAAKMLPRNGGYRSCGRGQRHRCADDVGVDRQGGRQGRPLRAGRGRRGVCARLQARRIPLRSSRPRPRRPRSLRRGPDASGRPRPREVPGRRPLLPPAGRGLLDRCPHRPRALHRDAQRALPARGGWHPQLHGAVREGPRAGARPAAADRPRRARRRGAEVSGAVRMAQADGRRGAGSAPHRPRAARGDLDDLELPRRAAEPGELPHLRAADVRPPRRCVRLRGRHPGAGGHARRLDRGERRAACI